MICIIHFFVSINFSHRSQNTRSNTKIQTNPQTTTQTSELGIFFHIFVSSPRIFSSALVEFFLSKIFFYTNLRIENKYIKKNLKMIRKEWRRRREESLGTFLIHLLTNMMMKYGKVFLFSSSQKEIQFASFRIAKKKNLYNSISFFHFYFTVVIIHFWVTGLHPAVAMTQRRPVDLSNKSHSSQLIIKNQNTTWFMEVSSKKVRQIYLNFSHGANPKDLMINAVFFLRISLRWVMTLTCIENRWIWNLKIIVKMALMLKIVWKSLWIFEGFIKVWKPVDFPLIQQLSWILSHAQFSVSVSHAKSEDKISQVLHSELFSAVYSSHQTSLTA